MISNNSTNQCDYPKLTLALSYALLALWLCVGMVTFHYVESPAASAAAAPSSLALDADVTEFIVDTLTIEVGNSRRNQAPRQQDSLAKNVDILGVIHFSNETSSYVTVTFSRPNITSNKASKKWDFPGALFFSLTVVTTIGYGNLAPTTNLGKFCCVIYAIIGIPLCFNVIGLIRKSLLRSAARIQAGLAKFGRCLRRRCWQVSSGSTTENQTDGNSQTAAAAVGDDDSSLHSKAWAATAILALFIYYIFLLTVATIIYTIEGWEFFSSLYYVFITLTTIGFGDLIAGQNRLLFDSFLSFGFYRLFLSFFTFFGMACASLLIHELEKLTERVVNGVVLLLCHRRQKDAAIQNSRQNTTATDKNNDNKESAGDKTDETALALLQPKNNTAELQL